jgi:pyridoxal 5'-phosphate synthase pdxT subunit
MTVGVLALQVDVREHVDALAELGEPATLVRRAGDLDGLDGLIVPGGESTTLSLLLESAGLFEPLAAGLEAGLPVFGTCAGMILLAAHVLDGRADQRRFGIIDLTVRRNGYGRQSASFECDLEIDHLEGGPVHAVFIRAPVVERSGPDVEVLARLAPPALSVGPGRAGAGREGVRAGGSAHPRPVVCRQGPVLVTSFHPELTGDRRLHQLFVAMTKEERR